MIWILLLMALTKTLVPLCEFQRDIVADPARYIMAVASRRVGKTFGFTNKIAHDLRRSAQAGKTGRAGDWNIVSRTQDTAKEALAEVATHLRAMHLVKRAALNIEQEETEHKVDGFRLSKFSLTLPSGVRCLAMTAHPDALRGFGGNVYLDEHAFHRDSKAVWRGAQAAVMRGGRLFVSSTPNFQIGNFFELARKCDLISGRPPIQKQNGIWSSYWIDINTALAQLAAIGVKIDIAELQELAGDDETYKQEFECQFLSGAEMWFSPEMIANARSPLATAQWNPDEEALFDGAGRLYVGVDVGRYRDLTVIYILRRLAFDMNVCCGVIAMANTPFPEQSPVVNAVLKHPHVARACIDNTGMGVALADYAEADEAIRHKVERITFSLESKEAMMVLLRKRMEERVEKMPENLPMLEQALGSIKATATATGHRRFDAARTDLAKHADAAWAMALAALAAESPKTYVPASDCNVESRTVAGNMMAMVM